MAERHTCVECQHSMGQSVRECKATRRIRTFWSDGERQTIYDLCDTVNTDGLCDKFLPVPTNAEWWADVKAKWRRWRKRQRSN
jgi:hypothetical protein